MTARVARGRETQRIVARLFQSYGAEYAYAVGAFEGGRDIRHVPVKLEVKATERVDLTGWLRQLAEHEGDEPAAVIYRPRGYGESRILEWPVIQTAEEYLDSLVNLGLLRGRL